jgi:hypothetical protein
MAGRLKRHWFEFEHPKSRIGHGAYIPACGCCGITAYNYTDALKILHRFFLRDNAKPIFSRVVENVDVSLIDDDNIQRDLGVPIWRGVWNPAYNLWQGPYNEK